MLNVLIGKSHLSFKIDKDTGMFIGAFYNHVETIKKHNGSDINANFFLNKENAHISAIIFATANLNDSYTLKNTFLFLNPYAKNKVNVKDFKNMVYWKINNHREYLPRKNGKNLWNDINSW